MPPRMALMTAKRIGSGGSGVTRRPTKNASVSSLVVSRTKSANVRPLSCVSDTPCPMQPTL